MDDIRTSVLPLLPLATGVVLPGMVVTMAIESEEAKVAIEATGSSEGRILLVPRVDGRYAHVGTVAKVEDSGELPSG
ncbi:MAG TPA: LON peptidase substrate-binding domain-containing protein, partial [Acidimicrobiales bacterium]|nr:LON peptidase substrate-binding domain-containing protein [Acidimicrobiales bacterium]